MQAMVLREPGGPLLLEELPLPKPGPGQVRIRVQACGVCRTDLHVADGELRDPKLPLVLGHQIVGVVDGVGAGVDTLSTGTRVGSPRRLVAPRAFVDDEQRLFRETEEILELEASLAGADLFFQGKPFFERAVEYPVSLKTPLLLARTFRASLHATIHYYIEHHPEPVAGLIAGQYPRMEGTVPVGQRCYFVDARTADAASLWAPDQGSGELTEVPRSPCLTAGLPSPAKAPVRVGSG